MKKRVVIGLLDPNLDASKKQDRWGTWRPTISISQHHDFAIDRFDLIHEEKDGSLAGGIVEDLLTTSPETDIRSWEMNTATLQDFSSSLKALTDFVANYRFSIDVEEYYLHVSNLTVPAQLALIFLASKGIAPARLIQSRMPMNLEDILGSYEIIDVRPGAAVDRLMGESASSTLIERSLKGGVETRNPHFNGTIRRMGSVLARRNLPLVISGRRGTGKSTLARRFFETKRERSLLDGPLVEADSRQLRPGQISQLLRAFTSLGPGELPGKVSITPGTGNAGVLLLRNIENLPAEDQIAIEETIQFGALAREMPGLPCEFQLIATTRANLNDLAQQHRFLAPLAERLTTWEFTLLPLVERLEDFAAYMDDEINQQFVEFSTPLRFRGSAKRKYLEMATAGQSSWESSLEDLHRSISRMAIESPDEGITTDLVKLEFEKLNDEWALQTCEEELLQIVPEEMRYQLDLFQKTQLMEVIRICMRSRSLSEAGRRLFASSRSRKKSVNDADRLRKYLQRFGLEWKNLHRSFR
ncbi:MAG: sigma 54-interacting transcriptional regulator [Bryobacterales bacterium]|nr:sigma 54-interacting transcriptional regulator [Bryobacterales bacterium]MCZ2156507.1 sigma 54-interacting transcriptional regulator [Bryobacterales bacterium]